jgi:DNA (cytosine-5)-methyltransferase 1
VGDSLLTITLDLFCGCGGLALGAHAAGLKPTLGVDIDPTLSSGYKRNFPAAKLINGDLKTIAPETVGAALGKDKLTAIVGGPPCQGFSSIGRRRSDDPRNALLRRYFEYIAELRPRFFLMENVPGLLNENNRTALDDALQLVPQNYRVLRPMVLNAADYGAPTSRPRLIVVGYDPQELDFLDESDFPLLGPLPRRNVAEAIADLPSPGAEWLPYRAGIEPGEYASLMRRLPQKGIGSEEGVKRLSHGMLSGLQATDHSAEVVARFSGVVPGTREPVSKYHRLAWDRPANVLRAGTGADKGSFQAARPIHPDEPRVITVREAARIQGFPDWFQFHPTKWHSHRMIGNSVSPIFAEGVLKIITSKMGHAGATKAA